MRKAPSGQGFEDVSANSQSEVDANTVTSRLTSSDCEEDGDQEKVSQLCKVMPQLKVDSEMITCSAWYLQSVCLHRGFQEGEGLFPWVSEGFGRLPLPFF